MRIRKAPARWEPPEAPIRRRRKPKPAAKASGPKGIGLTPEWLVEHIARVLGAARGSEGGPREGLLDAFSDKTAGINNTQSQHALTEQDDAFKPVAWRVASAIEGQQARVAYVNPPFTKKAQGAALERGKQRALPSTARPRSRLSDRRHTRCRSACRGPAGG